MPQLSAKSAETKTTTKTYDAQFLSVSEYTQHNCDSDWQPNPNTVRQANIAVKYGVDSTTISLPWDGPIPHGVQSVRIVVEVTETV